MTETFFAKEKCPASGKTFLHQKSAIDFCHNCVLLHIWLHCHITCRISPPHICRYAICSALLCIIICIEIYFILLWKPPSMITSSILSLVTQPVPAPSPGYRSFHRSWYLSHLTEAFPLLPSSPHIQLPGMPDLR